MKNKSLIMRNFFSICGVVFISINTFSQTALDSLRYVDLHIQPSFKMYYREIPRPTLMYDEAWKTSHNVKMMNWNGSAHQQGFSSTTGFSGFEGDESYPQASHDLLQISPASILLAAFSPFEKN